MVSKGIPEFLDSGPWTLDSGRCTLHATFRKLGSGHWTLLSTGSEQNQNPVSDSAYSIESIGSNVTIFRKSILTLNVTL